jgi:hypothetical protein
VRLNRSYSFGEWKEYGGGSGTFEQLLVSTPNSENPDDPYFVWLWVDWASSEFSTPLTAGSVIPVSMVNPPTLESPFTVDFYD